MQRDAAPARDSLRGQLMRSDSARFLDRMFCLDKGFADCDRPWDVQAAALGVRLERRLRRRDARDCGKHDLLFGRAARRRGGVGRRSGRRRRRSPTGGC